MTQHVQKSQYHKLQQLVTQFVGTIHKVILGMSCLYAMKSTVLFPNKVKFLSGDTKSLMSLLQCTLKHNLFLTNLKILQKYETHVFYNWPSYHLV